MSNVDVDIRGFLFFSITLTLIIFICMKRRKLLYMIHTALHIYIHIFNSILTIYINIYIVYND